MCNKIKSVLGAHSLSENVAFLLIKYVARLIVILTAGIMVVLTIAKLLLLAYNQEDMMASNILFPMFPNWLLLVAAVVLELIIIYQLLRNTGKPYRAGLWLLWFTLIVGGYRLGIYFSNAELIKCHCLGILGIIMGSNNLMEIRITNMILNTFIISGVTLLFLGKMKNKLELASSITLRRYIKLTAILLLTVVSSGFGKPIEITGTLINTIYNEDGRKSGLYDHLKFKIITDGVGWQIFSARSNSAPLSIACDGITTYTLCSSTNEIDNAAVGVIGTIDPCAIPLLELLPWWFLILNKNIYANLQEFPFPWANAKGDPQAYYCVQDIDWSENMPFLMSKAKFYYTRDRMKTARNSLFLNKASGLTGPSRTLENEIIKRMPDRILAADYAVNLWTNTALGLIPREFSANVYAFGHNYHGEKLLFLNIKTYGFTTGIREVETISYLPGTPYKIWIYDHRFKDRNKGVEYIGFTNAFAGWLTNRKEARLESARIFRAKQETAEGTSFPIAVIRFLIVAVFLAPICYFIFNVRTWNKHKTEKP